MRPDPTLGDLVRDIWAARRAVAVGIGLALCLMILLIWISPSFFRATMIVAPADGYALGDYASTRSEGEGLTIPFWRPREQDGVSTDFHRFAYTIKGPAVAAILLKDPAVLSGIAKDGRWHEDSKTWSAEELAGYLDRQIKVQVLGATPLRRLSYDHPDAVFAAAFLRKAHLVADQLIRRDRKRQSDSRIAYLQDALLKTANPDHRRGITDLLMQQEHIRMLANLDEPYAAIVVEAPAAGPRPVWPNKPLMVAFSCLLGGVAGYGVFAVKRRGL